LRARQAFAITGEAEVPALWVSASDFGLAASVQLLASARVSISRRAAALAVLAVSEDYFQDVLLVFDSPRDGRSVAVLVIHSAGCQLQIHAGWDDSHRGGQSVPNLDSAGGVPFLLVEQSATADLSFRLAGHSVLWLPHADWPADASRLRRQIWPPPHEM
jgi:hypothetical protein